MELVVAAQSFSKPRTVRTLAPLQVVLAVSGHREQGTAASMAERADRAQAALAAVPLVAVPLVPLALERMVAQRLQVAEHRAAVAQMAAHPLRE